MFQKYKEIVLYLFFGVLSFLLNMTIFFLFYRILRINELIANGFSWVLTVLFVFFTNRVWVFCASTETNREFFSQLSAFLVGRVVTLILEEIILLLFVSLLKYDSITVKIVAQFLVIISNYAISKWVVFQKKEKRFFGDLQKENGVMEEKRKKRIILAMLLFLTLFRFYLGIKTPVFLQADAGWDDFLYIQYATNILNGKWLGDFSTAVLVKTASPAILLVVNYVMGISYPVFLISAYLIAVFLFSLAMYRLMNSRNFSMILYVVLLYSPGMFHEENVQKVYRGGYIIIFTLLVFAAIIGQYMAGKNNHKREFFLWVALGCIALPIFYYLKEDTIWILPFVCGGIVITIIELWRGKHTWKQWKLIAVVAPLLTLGCVTVGYKLLNYHYYGEYAITDRSDTYCKEVLSDLLQIDDGEGSRDTGIWVTKNMIYTAAEHSETLKELLPYVDQSWNNWFGEGNEAGGDFYIWAFRDALQLSGAYAKGGIYVNSCYQEIHRELQKAYKNGELKKQKEKIYISPVMRGFTIQELKNYYGERFPKVIKLLATYQENITTSQEARGTYENLALMSNITGTHFRWSETNSAYYKGDELIVAVENKIVRLYQKIGWVTFWVGFIGIIGLILSILVQIVKKETLEREVSVLLVTLGLVGSCVLLMAAVTWFCSFLPDRKIYDYLCAAIPLMETAEVIGGYYLIGNILKFLKRYHRKIEK